MISPIGEWKTVLRIFSGFNCNVNCVKLLSDQEFLHKKRCHEKNITYYFHQGWD